MSSTVHVTQEDVSSIHKELEWELEALSPQLLAHLAYYRSRRPDLMGSILHALLPHALHDLCELPAPLDVVG